MAKSRASNPATDVRVAARVSLWDKTVGHVREYQNGRIGFNYDADYLSPRFLPLEARVFEFPNYAPCRRSRGCPASSPTRCRTPSASGDPQVF